MIANHFREIESLERPDVFLARENRRPKIRLASSVQLRLVSIILTEIIFNATKVRKNAAIAVSKITQNSETAREEFRRLHGIEILTARLKEIKF